MAKTIDIPVLVIGDRCIGCPRINVDVSSLPLTGGTCLNNFQCSHVEECDLIRKMVEADIQGPLKNPQVIEK